MATDEDWLYVAVVQNLFWQLVMGLGYVRSYERDLTCDASRMALFRRIDGAV